MISADLIREARRRAGLSQAQLGHRVGVPPSAISRWERGVVLPSLETLLRLVRACQLELVFELAEYDDSYRPHINRMLDLSPKERVRDAVRMERIYERLRGAAGASRG